MVDLEGRSVLISGLEAYLLVMRLRSKYQSCRKQTGRVVCVLVRNIEDANL
jgi:hypothetical protein